MLKKALFIGILELHYHPRRVDETPEQWAYLACWRNAFSPRVGCWHVSESLHTDLILTAFNRVVAISRYSPALAQLARVR